MGRGAAIAGKLPTAEAGDDGEITVTRVDAHDTTTLDEEERAGRIEHEGARCDGALIISVGRLASPLPSRW